MKTISIKTKVTLAATLLFLLSLLIVSSIQLYHLETEMMQLLGEQQHGFVERMADDIDQKLATHLNVIASTAAALPPELVADAEGLEKWARDRTGLRSLFTDVFVFSSSGSVLVDVPARGRHGINISEQENFQITVLGRKPYISRPFLGKALRQPVVTMSAPVLDAQGNIVAVLSGSINLLQPNFLGNLNEAKVGEGGSFSLITHDRLIVTSRNKDRIMTEGPAIGVSPYFDHAMDGREGWEEAINSRGLHALFSYTQLEEVPWTLVAALPIEEALAPVRHARRQILQGTLLIAFLVVPLIWFGVRRLYDPLQAALREREAGLLHAQAMAKLAHVITGPGGEFESWSETLPHLAGVAPADVPKATRDWLKLVHPDDRALFRERSVEAASRGTRVDLEYRLQRSDGMLIDIRQSMEPLAGEPGSQAGRRWFNTLQDITERKQSEDRVRRLNRVHAVLSGINTLIVRVRDSGELFGEACRIAVEQGQFEMAWIGVVEQDAMKIVPIASAGAEPEFLALIKDRFSLDKDAPMGNTMTARAVREKKAMVVNEMRENTFILFAKERMARGISSMAILPLMVSDQAVGVLALYAHETGFFDEEEMKLLMELAGDIGFALDHIAKAEKLDYLAYYDSLTGLANRKLFEERLAQSVDAAPLDERRFGLVLWNVERFKTINDTLGRQAGDALLRQIADRMRQHAPDPGRLARIGADHFAIVCPDIRTAEDMARRTEVRMQEFFGAPFRVGDTELRLSATAGIAMYPDNGADADTLFRNAEAALKRAKSSAERYVFHTEEMTARIAEKLSLENQLRQALEREEFVLHYQPKVDLKSGSVTGLEALIRWQSPELGLVPPGRFIPLLEETGLILQVGAWALRRAALDHRAWVEQKLDPPRVAVNVSAIQLRQRDFVQVVELAIVDGIAPTGIDLEITESLVMEDIQGNIGKLHAVRALGMDISIDDFGTGYSSLAYLATLPVQTLKIDRAFISKMLGDTNSATLVRTMISLAHSLGMKVVAEGVETEDQARTLRLFSCDQMQGYLFSKPLPLREMTALLGASGEAA